MKKLESMAVGQILDDAAESVPNKTAVVDGKTRATYDQLNRMASALAAALADIGFKKGDRAAIYMRNSYELMVAFYALQKLGVIAVWINSMYRKIESEFILEDSEARAVFIFDRQDDHDYLEHILAFRKHSPTLETLIVAGDHQGPGEEIYSFHDLIADGQARGFNHPAIDTRKDLSMLLYTSGTTGRPKGAMITHYAAVRAGWEYSRGVQAGADDIFIGFLPMTHSYGCGSILIQPMLLQATVVLVGKFKVEKVLQLIEQEKVTLQLAAPAHYILELEHKNLKNYDLSSLRAGLIAGMIAPEGLISRVEKEFGVYLTSFWGASEVGPGLGTMCPYPSPLEIREKYIGLPVADTRIRIVDPVTREELPDGETGELTLSGWHVMQGYWNNPEETAKQKTDGWIHMGDLASRDENGYIRVYGRSKDLINRGGYKIYPYELECMLVDHPKIEQVCIVATPNPVLGESICACVIPTPGQTVSLTEIREAMKGKVAPHKLPDELCIMEDFPRLSGGMKIKKFGSGGLAETAEQDRYRERIRK